MTRKSALASAAVGLVVLGGLYAWVELAKPFDKKTEAAEKTETPDPLLSVDPAQVTALGFSRGDGTTFVIRRNGASFSLAEPRLAEPRLLEGEAKKAFDAAARIAPDALIYDPEAPLPAGSSAPMLQDFGLSEDAARSVRVETADGKATILEFGDQSASGKTYARLAGDPRVWAFSSWALSDLDRDLIEFRDRSLPTVDLQKLTELRLRQAGEKELRIQPVDPGDEFVMTSHKMVSPFREPIAVDQQRFGDFLQKIPTATIDAFLDGTQPSLAAAGLAAPSMELYLSDGEKKLDLLLGADAGNGRRFAKLAGEKTIFLVLDGYFASLRDVQPFDLVARLPMLVGIDTLDSLTIDRPGEKPLVMSIQRNPAAVATAGDPGKKPEVQESYFMDGTKVEESVFKTAYQNAIGIAVDGTVPAGSRPAGAPTLTLTFRRNGGEAERAWSFVPLGADFLALVPGGTAAKDAEFAVSKVRLTTAMAEIDRAAGR